MLVAVELPGGSGGGRVEGDPHAVPGGRGKIMGIEDFDPGPEYRYAMDLGFPS